MKGVYVGLGANVGDRAGNLFQARRALATLPRTRLLAVSRLYETEPVGYREQPWFLNQVVELETDLPPRELLEVLMEIEAQHGRLRTVRWGPRPLDLDLLLYGSVELSTLALTLPHPRLWQRAFVLLPLSELAPQLTTPAGEPVAHAATRLAEEQPLHLWRPRLIGSPLLSLDQVDSTNAEALRLAQMNAAAGTVVVAGTQHRGRGRQGRRWLSPPGLGLYLSAVFRPRFLPPSTAPLFTMLGAVAARRAAEALGAPGVSLKWPNDLVAEERGTEGLRKLGGVLAETISAGLEWQALVLGIGLNLNHRPEDFPPDLRETATSLSGLTGREVPVHLARETLLEALNEVYLTLLAFDSGPLVEEFRLHLTTLGQEVTLKNGGRSLSGEAVDVDSLTGALVVRLSTGERQLCTAGEVGA
jgi:2-amino-4-hydroxy-6-hydroxymethyldihydropteridine diphosphokinase